MQTKYKLISQWQLDKTLSNYATLDAVVNELALEMPRELWG